MTADGLVQCCIITKGLTENSINTQFPTVVDNAKQEMTLSVVYAINIFTATNPSPSSHIPVGLNFLFPNFESNFRNRAMLLDETLIKLFDTDIGFKNIFCLTV